MCRTQENDNPYAIFYEIVEEGCPCKLRYEIRAKETRIGRYSQNDIIIEDEKVSRWHGRIFAKENMFFYEDFSKNGTKVNGNIINFDEVCLENEAIIKLGDAFYHFMIIGTGIFNFDNEPPLKKSDNTHEYKITIKDKSGKVESHIIKKKLITIGRSRQNDIIMDADDDAISRNHARIIVENNTCIIEDYSSNGTLINSEYIHNTKRELKDGDIVHIGNIRVLFEVFKPETKS
jgi:pSer/pThr/pTyr-binding forkhead associated (FHA) protein